VIWLHCGNELQIKATLSLAGRLIDQVGPDDVLITSAADHLAAFDDLPAKTNRFEVPIDSLSMARAFLDNWAPRALIWNGGPLRPTLLRQVV